MNDREQTQTLTDRRQEDRRGKGREVGMFEAMHDLVYGGERRHTDRRAK